MEKDIKKSLGRFAACSAKALRMECDRHENLRNVPSRCSEGGAWLLLATAARACDTIPGTPKHGDKRMDATSSRVPRTAVE